MAQPIRYILEYLAIDYTEIIYDCPKKWFNEGLDEIKSKCLFPNLPYINDGDFVLSETVTIAKYLCRKA